MALRKLFRSAGDPHEGDEFWSYSDDGAGVQAGGGPVVPSGAAPSHEAVVAAPNDLPAAVVIKSAVSGGAQLIIYGATDSGAPEAAIGTTYDLLIVYAGDARYRSAFDAAEARWEQIITGEIPDINTSQWGLIDDLRVDARIEAIDGTGGILGSAGPDGLRSGSRLPYHGAMRFDSADVESLFVSGQLANVILHEIGHIIGIGTIWGQLGLQNGGQYTGANALAEYRTLSGNPSASFVPVETDGGPGTAFGHWDEDTFDNELMTGFLDSGRANPISRMTIGALRDFGYTVNIGVADAYQMPGGPPQPPPQPNDDLADSLSDATAPFGQVAVNGSSTGTLEISGDRDWFRTQLTAGTAYVIRLEGAPTGAGTLSDPYLRFYNGSGALIAENDDFGGSLNAQLTFVAGSSGTYHIAAGAFGDSSTGSYRVTLTATNSAPTIMSGGAGDSAAVVRAEGASTAVMTVAATDADAGTTLTYAIAGGVDAAKFQINASSGVLSFITAPDFDAPADFYRSNAYEVQVRAIDNGNPNLSDVQTIIVYVTDVAGTDVNGDGGANPLTGTSENETIRGLGGNDNLNGGAAADNLLGGTGADRFVFDAVALNDALRAPGVFDRVSDYNRGSGAFNPAEGDQLDFSALLSSAVAGGQPAGWLVRVLQDRLDGAIVQVDTNGGAGGQHWVTMARLDGVRTGNAVNAILSAGQPAGTQYVVRDGFAAAVAGNFNADGTADLLLQHDDGRIHVLTMNGGQVVANQFAGQTSPAWNVLGAADFNADAKADLLMQNDGGEIRVLTMNGGQIVGNEVVGATSLDWHLVGARDFNADGKADLLLHNADGRIQLLTMNGAQVAASQLVGTTAPDWHIVGAADFNGDSRADILLKNDGGEIRILTMVGAQVVANQVVGVNSPDWHIVGAADFNGDARADLLLHNDSGEIRILRMNGAQIVANDMVGVNAPSWHIVGTGDYNGDGKADLLLHNDNGTINLLTMNGAQVIGNQVVGATDLWVPAPQYDLI